MSCSIIARSFGSMRCALSNEDIAKSFWPIAARHVPRLAWTAFEFGSTWSAASKRWRAPWWSPRFIASTARLFIAETFFGLSWRARSRFRAAKSARPIPISPKPIASCSSENWMPIVEIIDAFFSRSSEASR